ncbi:hypothetical protein M438DRAFT_350034 [Aureobasidium pullulans EXF-150]|uniref:Uncharacterized protein n=1 Tax=Aureobasidium pullulans EXF-150 TaxID=1043002 RepID=A0A074XA66_AURPU|nr:uncharacterized protein M438DRAFT_350034 [Aureobasidium pullulans EXF-150]KEQ78962.1 hypothetical protein M438DRAFT_350034 [Aureobasidium pullulans EXF-150]
MVLGDDVNGCYNYASPSTGLPGNICRCPDGFSKTQPGETCWRNDNDPECSNPLVEIACIS